MIIGDPWGALSNFITSFRRDWSANSLKRKQKRRLKKMLSDSRFRWRSLEQLANGIGADQQTTKNLLVEIHARPTENNPNLWGFERHNQGS